jgi:hypothetical protein
MSKKISLKLNKANFTDLVTKIHDISNINDVIKIKIEKDNIFMYSMKANDSAVLALKSYTIPTIDYIDDFNEDDTFDFIIINSPKFIKSLKFFDVNIQIKLDIIYKPHYENEGVMQVRSAQFTNGKLKISTVGGEDDKIRDLNTDMLDARTDLNKSKWTFPMAKQDFSDMKKLCSIDNEDQIVTILIEKGRVVAEEMTKWELFLCQIDAGVDAKLVFNKKYLSNINKELDVIDFYMFETFVLIKDDNSNLMLSFEQTFEQD